jgi:hypothetical protein
MALTTDARHEITTAFQAAGLPAYAYLPSTVSVPAVVITPADPYVEHDRIGATLTYTAMFRVSIITAALDNESGLAACEDLIDAVMTALPDGVRPTRVGPPLTDDLGAQGAAYVAEMIIAAHVTGPAPVPRKAPTTNRKVRTP